MAEMDKNEIVTLGQLEVAAGNEVLSSLAIPAIARVELEV